MSKRWKSVERAIADLFGGERIPITGRATVDVDHPFLAIEVKTKKRKLPKHMLNPLSQVKNAVETKGKIPIVVRHWKHLPYEDAIVYTTVKDFLRILEMIDDNSDDVRRDR